MIRDVTELREHGQVCRRVAGLQVDPDTWRAGMRRAARRAGMRIRTFVLAPLPAASSGNSDHAEHLGPLAYAVRTDLPPDHDKLMAMRNQPAAVRRVRSAGQACRLSA